MVVVVSGRVKVKVNVDVCGRECCISKVNFVLEIRKVAENCHGSPPSLPVSI